VTQRRGTRISNERTCRAGRGAKIVAEKQSGMKSNLNGSTRSGKYRTSRGGGGVLKDRSTPTLAPRGGDE